MKNKLVDLRNHLFLVIETLNDLDLSEYEKEDVEIEIKRSLAVVEVADAIIETGKLEVDFLRLQRTPDIEVNSEFFGKPQLKIENE